MSVSPAYLRFALAFRVCGDPRGDIGEALYTSETGKQALRWLTDNELIDHNQEATGRLSAWVKHLCEQPLPECHWVIPK